MKKEPPPNQNGLRGWVWKGEWLRRVEFSGATAASGEEASHGQGSS